MFTSLPSNSGNLFESINLDSTVSNKQQSRLRTTNIPESASATSDDDELDPAEFLSPEQPQIRKKAVMTTSKDMADTISPLGASTVLGDDSINNGLPTRIPDNEFFSNPSRILTNSTNLNDSLFNSSHFSGKSSFERSTLAEFPKPLNRLTQSNESPLEFLSNRNEILCNELSHSIKIHKKSLQNGDGKLNKVRSMISQNFDQLSETFYSLHEIYARDRCYTEKLYGSFQLWDKKRGKILSKIKSIKSDKNKHGCKLSNLLNESKNIDIEIKELEERIQSLKVKKKLISSEIEETSSVLESKTSKYVESFKILEKQGRDAIIDFLQMNGIPSKEADSILRTEPVDVTFFSVYKIQNSSNSRELEKPSDIKSEDVTQQESRSEIKEVGVEQAHKVIGMRPFIVPDETSAVNHTKNKDDYPSRLNYDHGTTAFEKGFAKGSESSHSIKNHVNQLIKALLLPSQGTSLSSKLTKTIEIDDVNNTINEQINLEPIVNILEHKIEALGDLILYTSTKATIFHEYSIIWKDVISILKSQEKKILTHISGSTPSKDEIDQTLIDLLSSTLEQIKECIENSLRMYSTVDPDSTTSSYNNLFHKVVLNEIKAICFALIIVSKDDKYSHLLSDFKNFGFPYEKLMVSSTRTPSRDSSKSPSIKPMSSSFKSPSIYKKVGPTTSANSLNFLSSGTSSIASDLVYERASAKLKNYDTKRSLFEFSNTKQVKKE